MVSYQVRIIIHHPDKKWKPPTNVDVEFVVSDAIYKELRNGLKPDNGSNLSVSVTSERLDT